MTSDTVPRRKYKVVGTRPIRHDGTDRVTGKALYGADILLPGTLHCKVLRSPHAHARLKGIDTSAAEQHPGVRGVATAADLASAPAVAQRPVLGQTPSHNILAREKVLYRGHPVAAIAATTPHIDEEALSLIEVEYEPLPSVTDVEAAMAPGAPILHEHWTGANGEDPDGTTVAVSERHRLGDLDDGFKAADLVLEREFRTRTVH